MILLFIINYHGQYCYVPTVPASLLGYCLVPTATGKLQLMFILLLLVLELNTYRPTCQKSQNKDENADSGLLHIFSGRARES